MEQSVSERELQKQKIRDRYKGTDSELLEFIPGKKKADFYDDVPRRVAVYVRVSTDNIQQTSSYELQKNYYEEYVNAHERWTLVEIYADEGISGTSLMHREAFQRMIEDCKAGKIDLILTKSVSRFSRNIVDCIKTLDELKSLKEPVGVFFETEHIFSLNNDSEMSISFTATMAQEESHIKSNIMNVSVEMRFSRGICLTPVLLGYDHDDDGKLIINETEALTVRLIFFMYLYGHSCQQIAKTLTELGRFTKKGNNVWNSGSILEILKNERYCGEILTRKTYTPNYKDHKSKKNNGERQQHRWKGEHQAIITKDDFIAVQHLIDNAKYGNKGFLPELKIITEGALKGFITVNPRWAGFKVEEYFNLAKRVCDTENGINEMLIEANSGDFDYRGFEVARSQFFNTSAKISVTFSADTVKFSAACIEKLNKCEYVEMLIHPLNKMLVVRPANSKDKNAVKWARLNQKGKMQTRTFSGAAYINTFYEMFDWNIEYKYRLTGTRCQKSDDAVLIFDLSEAEMYVGRELVKTNNADNFSEEITPLANTGKSVIAYPKRWAQDFGNGYYSQEQTATDEQWDIQQDSLTFEDIHNVSVTSRDEVGYSIESIIDSMKTEENVNE